MTDPTRPDLPPASTAHTRHVGLAETDLDPNPFQQFARWYQEAVESGLREPGAMTLATASADGTPSARMVLLKGMDQRGFVFYTNYLSQKGRELAENPRAVLVFYWAELERQVRVAGEAARLPREESERYFRTRPLGAQLSALASRQSQVIPDRTVLERRVAELVSQYQGREVPLPDDWGGFRLAPRLIEFWKGRTDRLHDRLRYSLGPDGSWAIERLSP